MPMTDCRIESNGSFCLRAEVLGYPAPIVTFYKDDADEPLMAQSQLHKTARSPVGMYELIAENSHGSSTCKANVFAVKIGTLQANSPKTSNAVIAEKVSYPTPEIRRPVGLPPNGKHRMPSQNSLDSRASSIQSNTSLTSIETKNKANPVAYQKDETMSGYQKNTSSGSNASVEKQGIRQLISPDPTAKTLNEVKNQMKSRRLAPNFRNSFDKGDGSDSPPDRGTPQSTIYEVKTESLTPAQIGPAYCGPPVPYVSKRACSPADSEYFSGGYESACMETPTQSPIASPVPLIEQLILPYEDRRQVTSDSDTYLTSNEHMQSDGESMRRVNSSVSSIGITSEEEYLTAGGLCASSSHYIELLTMKSNSHNYLGQGCG